MPAMMNSVKSSAYRNHGCRPEDGVADMTVISNIDEKGINLNLNVRYSRDQIYTCAGTILVAVNPYKELLIYGQEQIDCYHKNKITNKEPHVYLTTELAFNSLQQGRTNQSILISGESGAGKTETAKFVLHYLCSVTSNISTWVQHQIIEANTVLEAFGNAKTVRNDNSSRFGKFMQVCFDSQFKISGCIIQDYLLELSRITVHGPGERNYHVFYQLLAGAQQDKELAEQLLLGSWKDYEYVNQSGCCSIEGVDDAARFDALRLALSVLQVAQKDTNSIFAVLAAVLWLGNLQFQDVDGEKCELTAEDMQILGKVSALLGLEVEQLSPVLVRRQINVRGNVTEIPLRLNEARENRHAMARVLYSRTFSWLLTHINRCTNPGQNTSHFLGILDIFGFENFQKNSFEQLCINYTNEKLHRFFNHYVFALEQEIYRTEEIQFAHIQFTDNTACVELIEKPPRCILKLLSEQCHMPKGSDLAYINNLHGEFDNHAYYIKGEDRRRWEEEFGVRHYAGCVVYAVEGFVDKNRDVQQEVFIDVLSQSTKDFVQNLTDTSLTDSFVTNVAKTSVAASTIPRGTNKSKPTKSDTFRIQLQSLVDVLQATNPWYVRCIKPNEKKLADRYNEQLVLDQLRYLGMLDIIRIRREGYPIHFEFEEFVRLFKSLCPEIRLPATAKDAVRTILQHLKQPATEWQIGKSKVFLRLQIYDPLEETRLRILNQAAVLIQSWWRGHTFRQQYRRIRKAALVLQHAFRGWQLRIMFLRKRRAAVVIQSHLRGMFAREVAAALREMRRVEAEARLREKEREKELERLAAQEAETAETLEEVSSISDQDGAVLQSQSSVEESSNAGRPTQNDLHALSHLAEQMNTILAASKDNDEPMKTATTSGDNVDLDNLFAFLSEIHADGNRNALLEEIENHMVGLVTDFEQEIELASAAKPVTPLPAARNAVSPTPTYQNLTSAMECEDLPLPPESPSPPPPPLPSASEAPPPIAFGLPTLPEPTEKPPPPPQMSANENEPIYEAIRPRSEDAVAVTPSAKPRTKLPEPQPQETAVSESWKFDRENREARRKQRIVKKLQELEEDDQQLQASQQADHYHDLIEFAEKHFNVHEKEAEGALVATITRRSKKANEISIVPKYEMIIFTKSTTIPTSHLVLYDQDSVTLACSVFKDLCRYMRGEMKSEDEINFLQSTVHHCLEREELRDEIYVQCMRQSTGNASADMCEKVWVLLALCIVAFPPSKTLQRYLDSFVRKNSQQPPANCGPLIDWCYEKLRTPRVAERKMPPSSLEIAAVRRLGSVVCRVFFLDGRSKAVDVAPLDTACDIIQRLAERLSLSSVDGWALYQVFADGRQSHVKGHEFLFDILSSWELKTHHSPSHSAGSQSGSSGRNRNSAPQECRLFFFRRLFRGSREISEDPAEIALLYGQAVHSVVTLDDYPINDKVALQLAGLQLQVALGDPQAGKDEAYRNIDTYLSSRILNQKRRDEWPMLLCHAHRQYGTGKSELIAKVWYLSCVMHFPLYGTTMFAVTYRGYWAYGNKLILGINCDGVALIKPDDKFVIYEYRYADIESILVDPSDDFFTLTLLQSLPDAHKCLVFETKQKDEIASLLVSYCPALSYFVSDNERPAKRLKPITGEDKQRRFHNLINCRRQLIDSGVLRKPADDNSGFLRSTLRRLNKQKVDKLRAESLNAGGAESYKGFHHAYWAFTRHPLVQSLGRLPEVDEKTSLEIFRLVMVYSGLLQNVNDNGRQSSEEDLVPLAQSILERSMKKESLFNELVLQLIKQTTDHPEVNSRVNMRHWALLTLACSLGLPQDKIIRKYLVAHLKLCSADVVSEEGKFARFAEKCLFKTMNSRRRQWPPSTQEVLCTTSRRPIYTRVYLMDGSFHAIEFDPSAAAREVIEIIKNRIGLRSTAQGFALYEVLGDVERSLTAEEKLTDVMGKWERYRNSSTAQQQQQTQQHHAFLFKKHLFLDEFTNLSDPVEKELLYFQMLHSIRVDRFPITDMEAIMICSLRAQIELGDYNPQLNYAAVLQHCLPPRILPFIATEVVQLHHQSLFGMTPHEAKQAFFNIIHSWPLHKATFFDVTQSFTSNWPKCLWLAVDQRGLHLLEHRSRHVLCHYDYAAVVSISPTLNCLMVVTGTDAKPSKVILNTHQAFQIANLVREYCEVLQVAEGLVQNASPNGSLV